ncbi:hypothetical protein EJ05DRAFT_226506 [Pseudovirgaria hyperparasitica]|uniref:AB hydrolase-1 domain-containing protein n=1 Tax=Pseudovirgaria hyperparasitica TaxID=470096 RepID=A0A6A6VR44_9PEZI|nr:uncharacterized protein EJ05DRAFT_226506 [Pseudovirgaria hyperparasitica]KAF2753138.1 hypothetical protein EJ05DRAFT_226506 [Pseudovirgaria hyperparasitica]
MYNSPAHYTTLLTTLRTKFPVSAPQLPSSDPLHTNAGTLANPTFANPAPASGLPSNATDAVLLAQILDDLVVAQGKYVVMIAHSAGGASSTEAAKLEYLVRERKAKGQKGGVLGILYMTTFAVCKGGSASMRFGEYYAAVEGKDLACFKIHVRVFLP